jgi:hypothetical protein
MTPEELARRLEIPERGPDDGFVLRVDRTIDIAAADRAAARARREEMAVELLAAAALFLAARQILPIGDGAANLFLPLLSQVGGLALVAATLSLFLTLLSADRYDRTRSKGQT